MELPKMKAKDCAKSLALEIVKEVTRHVWDGCCYQDSINGIVATDVLQRIHVCRRIRVINIDDGAFWPRPPSRQISSTLNRAQSQMKIDEDSESDEDSQLKMRILMRIQNLMRMHPELTTGVISQTNNYKTCSLLCWPCEGDTE